MINFDNYDIIKDQKKDIKRNLFKTSAKLIYKLPNNKLYYKYYFHKKTN